MHDTILNYLETVRKRLPAHVFAGEASEDTGDYSPPRTWWELGQHADSDAFIWGSDNPEDEIKFPAIATCLNAITPLIAEIRKLRYKNDQRIAMYSYSFDGERFYGSFATREEAIKEARAERPESSFETGENVHPPAPESLWHAEDWIEHVACQDEYCGEHCDDWGTVSKEALAELESQVRPIMATWLDKHGLLPTFFNITNTHLHDPE